MLAIAGLFIFTVLVAVWLAGPVLLLIRHQEKQRNIVLAAIIGAVAIGSAAFRMLIGAGLQQSAALFIGIPALLAIAAVFAPTPRSATGVACKSVTVGLLVSLVFLGEGIVCVLMSAPLFYLVAIFIGKAASALNQNESRGRSRFYSLMVFMAVAPMSVEGVVPVTTIDRHVVVSETRIVAATPEQVAGALVAPPRFDRVLPAFLGIGFPRPTSTRIDGTRWVITMRGGEMRLNGMEPRSGDLVLAIDKHGPGFLSWRALADDSHMRHFLTWQSSRVEWQAVDAEHTRVTWTIRYSRDLDPALVLRPDGALRGPSRRRISHRRRGNAVTVDGYLLIRAAALYLPIVMLAAAWLLAKPDRRRLTGAFMSMAWNAPALMAVHLLAERAGWWHFDAAGGTLLRFPVDLWLAWAILWGPLAAFAFPSAPLIVVVAAAAIFDLIAMPAGFPVVRLGDGWLIGEAVALAICLVPAQLLARWTATDRRLHGRALLQVVAFSGLLGVVLPALAIENGGAAWVNPLTYPRWILSVVAQVLAVPALVGFTAVQEFVARGRGTPVPCDPPRRLVSSGIYAYVANPMQLSAVVLLILLGALVQNPWVAAAGVVAHIYSVGIAGWDEESDLRARFGNAWQEYRERVRRWVPQWRPWYRDETPVATLYVSEECEMCREVAGWFRIRGARGLSIVPAEDHPNNALTRITYESVDGTYRASGMEAVARALEHVHLGWAIVSFAIRMPIVAQFVQLLADASGAEPRPVNHRRSATSRSF